MGESLVLERSPRNGRKIVSRECNVNIVGVFPSLKEVHESVVDELHKYYVYGHYKPNSAIPFNIGKGCGWRAISKTDRNLHWHNTVNKNGYIVEIMYFGLTKEQALDIERMLIAKYGRADKKCGPLVNQTDGGDDPPSQKGTKQSQSQRDATSKRFKNKKQSAEWIEKRVSKIRAKPRPDLAVRGLERRGKYKFIYNTITCKKKLILIGEQVPVGWVLGQGPRTSEQIENSRKNCIKRNEDRKGAGILHTSTGRRGIYNKKTFENRFIKQNELIPDGWCFGRPPRQKYQWIHCKKTKERTTIPMAETIPEGWEHGSGPK